MRPLLRTATVVVVTLVAGGATLALTMATASAHIGPITITCDTITVNYSSFPSSGTNAATVTINGTPSSFTWQGPTYPFSAPRPTGAVTVTTNWRGSDGATGSASSTDSGSACSHPTTTAPTPTTASHPVVPPGTCIGPPIACGTQQTTTTVQVVPAVQPETAPAAPTGPATTSAGAPATVAAGRVVSGAQLASTGTDSQTLAWLGVVLAGVGLALVGLTRRHRSHGQ